MTNTKIEQAILHKQHKIAELRYKISEEIYKLRLIKIDQKQLSLDSYKKWEKDKDKPFDPYPDMEIEKSEAHLERESLGRRPRI